jgi:hypothetical protein
VLRVVFGSPLVSFVWVVSFEVAFSAALVWRLCSGLLLFSPGAFLAFVLVFSFLCGCARYSVFWFCSVICCCYCCFELFSLLMKYGPEQHVLKKKCLWSCILYSKFFLTLRLCNIGDNWWYANPQKAGLFLSIIIKKLLHKNDIDINVETTSTPSIKFCPRSLRELFFC